MFYRKIKSTKYVGNNYSFWSPVTLFVTMFVTFATLLENGCNRRYETFRRDRQ